MNDVAWIVVSFIVWGFLLLTLILGMLKSAKDQDRQIDETNSRYLDAPERETDV